MWLGIWSKIRTGICLSAFSEPKRQQVQSTRFKLGFENRCYLLGYSILHITRYLIKSKDFHWLNKYPVNSSSTQSTGTLDKNFQQGYLLLIENWNGDMNSASWLVDTFIKYLVKMKQGTWYRLLRQLVLNQQGSGAIAPSPCWFAPTVLTRGIKYPVSLKTSGSTWSRVASGAIFRILY